MEMELTLDQTLANLMNGNFANNKNKAIHQLVKLTAFVDGLYEQTDKQVVYKSHNELTDYNCISIPLIDYKYALNLACKAGLGHYLILVQQYQVTPQTIDLTTLENIDSSEITDNEPYGLLFITTENLTLEDALEGSYDYDFAIDFLNQLYEHYHFLLSHFDKGIIDLQAISKDGKFTQYEYRVNVLWDCLGLAYK